MEENFNEAKGGK